MSISTIAALAVQAAAPQNLSCSLVTPDATAVEFTVAGWDASRRSLGVARRTAASAWPKQSLDGKAEGSSGHSFSFGGANGLLLDLGQSASGAGSRTALLSRRARGATAHPVAFGFCNPVPANTTLVMAPIVAGADAGADIAAFDPVRWPTDCAMVTDRGAIVRFDYTIKGERVELVSPTLWSGRPVLVPIAFTDKGARFGSRQGPAGSDRWVMDARSARAAKLIHFARLGDSSAQAAYGICGYNQIVRRPNVQ
jgi:hypothetical protein